MNWIRDNLRTVELALFGALAFFVAFLAWKHFLTPVAPVGVQQAAIEAPGVKNVPRVIVQVPHGIKAYANPKLPGKVLIASSEVRSDPRPQVISTTLDPLTGEVTTTKQSQPYHWMEAKNTKEISISYGWRGTKPMWRLEAAWTPLQIKGWDLSAKGSLDADGQTYIGGRLRYQW